MTAPAAPNLEPRELETPPAVLGVAAADATELAAEAAAEAAEATAAVADDPRSRFSIS